MGQTVLRVTVPDSVVSSLPVRRSQLGGYIRQTMAVELYREGRLSLGKAKELAGFANKREMFRLLAERGVAVDYTADDAVADNALLDRLAPGGGQHGLK